MRKWYYKLRPPKIRLVRGLSALRGGVPAGESEASGSDSPRAGSAESASDLYSAGATTSSSGRPELDGVLPPYSLDHLIPLSERHLRAILTEFVHYYNHDRPHRSLGLQPPAPRPQRLHGGITVRPVLGGLHHVYQRAA